MGRRRVERRERQEGEHDVEERDKEDHIAHARHVEHTIGHYKPNSNQEIRRRKIRNSEDDKTKRNVGLTITIVLKMLGIKCGLLCAFEG